MKDGQHALLRAVEDRLWWHQILHQQVLEALSEHVQPGARVLDAGCGTGGLLAKLSGYEVRGCDASAEAVELCRQRGLDSVCIANVEAMPWADGFFDAVLSLDVLYHERVHEDRALTEMRRVLKPCGGLLVMNVPALACLRGAHDAAVGGAQRYDRETLGRLLQAHGFELLRMHYWNAWLFLPLLLRRRFSNDSAGDLKMPPRWLNALLAVCGRLDAQVCRKFRPPFGSSLFAVARAAKKMP